MSSTDANWRSGGGTAPYYPPFDPGGDSTVDLLPFPHRTVNIFPIACGSTTDWYVRSTDLPPVYRSNNFAENAQYHAANGTLHVLAAGPLEITLTGITSAVLTRDLQHRWYADNGVIQVDVPVELIGPFVLEVWSTTGGDFSAHVTCTTGLAAYWTFGSSELHAGTPKGALPAAPTGGSWSWPGGSSAPGGDVMFSTYLDNTQTPATPSLYTDEIGGLELNETISPPYVLLNFVWSAGSPWHGPGLIKLWWHDPASSSDLSQVLGASYASFYQVFPGVSTFPSGVSSTINFQLETLYDVTDANAGTVTFFITQA